MKMCVLFGSPSNDGITATLLEPFLESLKANGVEIDLIHLYNKKIAACDGCFTCQDMLDQPGCAIEDDMLDMYQSILRADCLIYATPIYSWYCTPPMKSVMDRLFALNKFYGSDDTVHRSLWDKKAIALVATCGYEIEYGVDLLEEGLKRGCKHSNNRFIGTLAVSDGDPIFQDESRIRAKAAAFAESVLGAMV